MEIRRRPLRASVSFSNAPSRSYRAKSDGNRAVVRYCALPRPDERDLVWWQASLTRLSALTEPEVKLVAEHVQVRSFAVGQAYLRAGDRCTEVGLVRAGLLLESFAVADGRERIRGFAAVGDFAGSLADLMRPGPARSDVIALAPTRILSVTWSKVRAATAAHAGWSALIAAAIKQLYLVKADREYELLALDARARYARFRERWSSIEEDIPRTGSGCH